MITSNSEREILVLVQDSLYVLDNAFYFFLASAFQKVSVSFDMFEDTSVTRGEW